MADKLNIIVGAAQFWIGTPTAVVPNWAVNTSYNTTLTATANWRNVGYTKEGVEVTYTPEYTGVEVDQLLDDAKLFKTRHTMSVNTTFAESTLENLLVVWGQATNTLTSSGTGSTLASDLIMTGGELGASPVERKIIAVGNGTEVANAGYYNERTYIASRAISVEETSTAMRRSEESMLPVSFRLLPDDTTTGNPYGRVHDRVRTATWA